MMQQEIRVVPVSLIDPNPHRDLKTYPWIEEKIRQLQRSIKDVGLWPGIIARPAGKRYQLAFGHHRLESARRNKLKEVALIIEPLSDERMLQFMGRENGEDYNAEFLVMLNTWEAAIRFFSADRRKKPQGIEIARFLGWTATNEGSTHQDQMNHTARACHSAALLIGDGRLARDPLSGMTVYEVENLTGAAFNRMQQMEALGKQNKASADEIEAAKQHIAKATIATAEKSKAGKLAKRDIRSELDLNTYRFAREAKIRTPLFAAFGKTLIEQIERMLNSDAPAEKLAEVRKSLPDITEHEDKQIIQRLDLALEQLGDRADDWRKKLTHPSKKLVSLVPAKGA